MKRKSNSDGINLKAKRIRVEENHDSEFFISSKPQNLKEYQDSKTQEKKTSKSLTQKTKIKKSNHKNNSAKPKSIQSSGLRKKQRRPDVNEARTVFVSNLSPDADEKKLTTFLSKFGKLNFMNIVKDKLTFQSRGSAFVKFAYKQDADNILLLFSKPENADQFMFEGRPLNLVLAVSREEHLEKQKDRKDTKQISQNKETISDVAEARTIFMRNLSFDADEEHLHKFLSTFGQLEFVKIVKDKMTQHSRGTAFAKFVSKDDTDRILLASSKCENAHRFLLSGRPLILSLAISKDDVEKKQKARTEGDLSAEGNESANFDGSKGRNLHLARIGLIRPGTQQADDMTSHEASMRESVLRAKEAKLKNPQIFISPLRICLRNIPLEVDDKMLRHACQNIVGSKARITEARVMRDLKGGANNPKSMGFAFVAFEEHKDALKALHEINNKNTIFGGVRKPIVEFSLENSRALEIRKKRAEKSLIVKEGGMRPETTQPQKSTSFKMKSGRHMKGKKSGGSSMQKGMRILPKKFGPKIRHNRK